jgi:hypothetical protein
MLKRIQIAGILFVAALAGAATIVTTRATAKVYPTPIRRVFEQPIFVLDKGEVVEVLEWSKPLTRIRNRKGRVGFVDIELLDSLRRPPILRLMIDSEPEPATTIPPMKSSKHMDTQSKAHTSADSVKTPSEKPVDFRGDSSHITPRSIADSTKH